MVIHNFKTTVFIYTALISLTLLRVPGYPSDFKSIKGNWVRTDGSYVIQVQNINPDQTVIAKYLNPSEINVSEAKISNWKGLTKLFIKLQDKGKGYPGSTYTLYYYTQKNALAGFYYQAEQKKTYEVIFLRQSGP